MQIDPNISLESQIANLKEDLFQVNYNDKFIVDVGWYSSFSADGRFQNCEDFNWESPIFQKTCRTLIELIEYVEEAVRSVKESL